MRKTGHLGAEIVPIAIPQKKGEPIAFAADEHMRATSLKALAKLKPVVLADGSVTAGNASGLNDGAAATLIGSKAAAAGIAPRMMGVGPIRPRAN